MESNYSNLDSKLFSETVSTSSTAPTTNLNYCLISIEKWVALLTLTFASIFFGLIPRWIFFRFSLNSSETNHGTGNGNKKRKTGKKIYNRALVFLSSLSGGVLLATTMLHILPEVREKAENISVTILWYTFPKDYPLFSELLMLYGFCLIYLFEVVANFILRRHQAHKNNELSNKSLIDGGIESNHPKEGVKRTKGSWRVLISLAALSFHAVMEGVAVGVQHASKMWYAFGAIASHKFIISLCLGMELVKSQAQSKTLIGSIVTFSIVSPIGILLGSSAQASMDANNGILVTIEGLACGTLLYVVFFEILTKDQHQHHNNNSKGKSKETDEEESDGLIGFLQFLGTFLGISLSTWLMSGSHSHVHEESSFTAHLHD